MAEYAAHGTMLQIGDGSSPETFTTIAQVLDISGPKLALDAIETTTHNSTDGWKERIGGLLDGGEVSFDILFDPEGATHGYATGMVGDMVNRAVRNFKIVFPDEGTTTWSFSALVTGFETSEPVGDALKASVTLTITGKPTLE